MTCKRPIILCGFMASGKTTIGRLTARSLQVPFYDTDELIVRKAGLTIPEIFALYGESGFRDMEHEVAKSVSSLTSCVISTGGGMLTFDRNGEVLRSSGTIVLLSRDFETIWATLSGCTNRPLVQKKPKEEVRALYDTRLPLYERYAHLVIENNGSPESCVSRLIARLP